MQAPNKAGKYFWPYLMNFVVYLSKNAPYLFKRMGRKFSSIPRLQLIFSWIRDFFTIARVPCMSKRLVDIHFYSNLGANHMKNNERSLVHAGAHGGRGSRCWDQTAPMLRAVAVAGALMALSQASWAAVENATFSSGPGEWEVPSGVTKITITAIGGGGGGGGGARRNGGGPSGTSANGGAGGGGAQIVLTDLSVKPGSKVQLHTGGGGGGGGGASSGGHVTSSGGGGGGSTYVQWTTQSNESRSLIAAGGGGGSGASTSNPSSVTNGGVGCLASLAGGEGGGGGVVGGSGGAPSTTVGGGGNGTSGTGSSASTGGAGQGGAGDGVGNAGRTAQGNSNGGGGAGYGGGGAATGSSARLGGGAGGSDWPTRDANASNSGSPCSGASNGGAAGIAAPGSNDDAVRAGASGGAGQVVISWESVPTQTLTCPASGQSITWGQTVPGVSVSAPTGTTAGAVSYSNVSNSACTTGGGVPTTTGIGACSYTATAAASGSLAATSKTCDIGNVVKATPVINWMDTATTVAVDGQVQLTATSTSGEGAASFSAGSSTGCSVTQQGGVVTGTAAGGSCVVTFAQAESDHFLSASSSHAPIAVTKGVLSSLTVSWPPSIAVGTGSSLVVTSYDTRGGFPTISTISANCTVTATSTGATVTGSVANQSCVLGVEQAESANYYGEASSISLPVGKGKPVLSWQSVLPALKVGESVPPTLTANSSVSSADLANPVTYSAAGSPNANGCTVTSVNGVATITATHAGTCTITASQNGNANYENATSIFTSALTVSQGDQNLTWSTPTATTMSIDQKLTQTATTTVTPIPSGNAVTYKSNTDTVCSVNGSTGEVTALKAGTCTIAANLDGNADYKAATELLNHITVGTAKPQLTWSASVPSLVVGDTTKSRTATSNATGTNASLVVYSSSTQAVCTIDSSTGVIQALKAGDCTVHANQAASAGYYDKADQIDNTLTVGKANQKLTFPAQTTATRAFALNGTFDVSPEATSDHAATTRPVKYSSATVSVCDVAGKTVTMKTAGICTLNANQDGDGDYTAAAQQQQSVQLSEAKPTLTWGTVPSLVVGDKAKSLVATSSVSDGSAIQYSSKDVAICAVDSTSGVIDAKKKGTCTLVANQPAKTDFYVAANAIEKDIEIGQTAQTLTFSAQSPAQRTFERNTTFDVLPLATSDHADEANRPVTYSSTTATVCQVTGKTVKMLKAGTCTIAADQGGDDTYTKAAQKTQDVVFKSSKTFSGTTVPEAGTPSGTATVTLDGGGEACGFDTTAGATAFEKGPGTLASGETSKQGQFRFKLLDCDQTAVKVSIQWPQPVTGLRKLGKATPNADKDTFFEPTNLVISKDGLTTSYTVKDGELGDDDWTVNGEIVDPVVSLQAAPVTPPVTPSTGAVPVPVLQIGSLALLSIMASVMGAFSLRRRTTA